MPKASSIPRTRGGEPRLRLIAVFMALCYGWLAGVASFQHSEAAHYDTEALLCTAAASAPVGPASLHGRQAAHPAPPATPCPTCEWQAANLSPALPAFALAFTPCAVPQVVTTLPRTLHPVSIRTSSRAPPLA